MGSLGDTLSVAIGIVFVYLLLSVIASYIQEWIASLFNLRASFMVNAVQLLLNPAAAKLDGSKQIQSGLAIGERLWAARWTPGSRPFNEILTDQVSSNILPVFYAHPIIKTLAVPGKLPSYISARDFSTTLFDIILNCGTTAPTQPAQFLESLKNGILSLPNEDLKSALLPYILNAESSEQSAEKKVAMARENIESWFNSTMDRAVGWYRRRMQWIAIILGLVIAVSINADTISITQNLWRDAALRQSIGDAATAYIQKDNAPQAQVALTQLSSLNLPIGWSGQTADLNPATPNNPQDFPSLPNEIFLKVLGLLITGLAISHGSSLWFDILGKLVNLRSSGIKPDDSSPQKG